MAPVPLPSAWLPPLLAGQRRILERMAAGAPLTEILQELCLLVESILPDRRCAVLTVAGSTLRVGSAPSLPEAFREAVDGSGIGPGHTPCGMAAATRQPVMVNDFERDPEWAHTAPLARALGLCACATLPIPGPEDTCLGTFALYRTTPGGTTPEEVGLLEACAAIASAALQGHLREVQAHALLVQSEAHYRQTFQNLPVPAYIWDPASHRFLAVNAAALNTYGYAISEFLSLRITDLRFAEDMPRMDEVLVKMPRGYHRAGPVRHRTKSGESLVVDLSSHDVVFEGRPARVTVALNLTDRIQMEERYGQLVEAVSEGIAIVDELDVFEFANPAAHRMFGVEGGTLHNRSVEDFLPVGQLEVLHRETRLRRQGQASSYRLDIVRPDGERRILEVKAVPRLRSDGTYHGTFVVFLDITEKLKTETALRASEERFRKLFEAIPQGVLIHQEGRILYGNPAAVRIGGGATAEDIVGRQVLDFVHPDDHGIIIARQKVLAGGGQVPFTELRCLWADGTIVEVESLSLLLEPGNPATYMVVFHDISDRKRAMEALRASEQRFRKLFEATPLGVIIHQEGRILYVNPATAAIAGLESPEEAVGRPILEFIEPGDHEQTLSRIRSMKAGETLQPVLFHCRRSDGMVVPCESISRVLEEGDPTTYLVVFQDIRRRLEAEEALRQSEFRFRKLFEAIPLAVVIHREGGILYANPAAVAAVGIASVEEAIGGSILRFLPPADVAIVQQRQVKLDAGEELPWIEMHHCRADGTPFPVESRMMVLDPGPPVTYLSVFQDISERKRTEEGMRQAQKLESLGVLAGGIAHDFNNLLTAMMGNLNLAQMAAPEHSPVTTYLENLENAVVRASDLTRQMLAYSGRGRFVVKTQDLNALVRDMTNLLKVSISKRVNLRVDLDPGLPSIEADASQLQQVVMNLVINGNEAIGEGDGEIRIHTRSALLSEADLQRDYPAQNLNPGAYALLEVTDNGSGMPPEVMARIFDPFFTTKATGRGLGLSAIQGILRGHRAGIHLESLPAQGTCFRLAFPASDGAPAVVALPPPAEGRREHRGRILLVDDEVVLREPLRDMLEMLGHEVVEAGDGIEALARYHEVGGELVAVILDLTMPRMDGRETLAALRKLAPDLPVLLSSGYEEGEALDRLMANGPTVFLQKPYTLKALRAALVDLLPKGL